MFLKQSGLVKRRPIAKALCDGGKIQRNGQVAKAGDDVRVGDTLRIQYGVRTVEAKILAVPLGSIPHKQRDEYYQITKEEREAELEF